MSFSRILPFLPTRGNICSRLGLLSSSISVVQFHSHNNIPTNPNCISHSTHISDSHFKLRRLLVNKSKSGFDKLDNALVLFDKMLKMRPLPNAFDFTKLLAALVKTKQYHVAVSLFTDMCILKIPVNIFTFNIAINCCCHFNRLDYAFSLLAGVFTRGFVPNVATYNALIRGLLSQHNSAEARVLFGNLIKFRQLRLNVVTFNRMIDGLNKTDHMDMALWLFRFMEDCDCKPDVVTYRIIVDFLCKHGLVDDALNLLSGMFKKGILPDVWTYSAIIQALCNSNRREEGSMLLKQMIDDMNFSPNVETFNILVDAYSRCGKLDSAKQLIEMMNERGEYPDIVTYNNLMQAYCTQGQLDGALAVLNTIKSKEMRPDCFTYNILLDGLCGLGKPMEALTFFYKIQDQGYVLNIVIYRTMLHGLCKNQYVDKALSLFHLMSSNGLIPDRSTYNIIIRGCLRNKKYSEASKLVDKMVDCGFLADAITTSLLQHLLLSEVHDPALVAIHQKCLHSGQKRITSVKVEQLMPKMRNVIPVDFDSEVEADDSC